MNFGSTVDRSSYLSLQDNAKPKLITRVDTIISHNPFYSNPKSSSEPCIEGVLH